MPFSHLVFGAGYGIRLYQFLIIAFLSTLSAMINMEAVEHRYMPEQIDRLISWNLQSLLLLGNSVCQFLFSSGNSETNI